MSEKGLKSMKGERNMKEGNGREDKMKKKKREETTNRYLEDLDFGKDKGKIF